MPTGVKRSTPIVLAYADRSRTYPQPTAIAAESLPGVFSILRERFYHRDSQILGAGFHETWFLLGWGLDRVVSERATGQPRLFDS